MVGIPRAEEREYFSIFSVRNAMLTNLITDIKLTFGESYSLITVLLTRYRNNYERTPASV